MRGAMIGTLALVGALAACGDDGATKNQFEAYCAAYCGWKDRCGDAASDCVSHCGAEGQNLYARVRSEAVQTLSDCFSTMQDCGSDDACFEQAVRAVAPALTDDPKYKACAAARASCPDSPFNDDYCASLLILVSSAQAEFEACYDEPCDQMRDCVKKVTGEGTADDTSP